MWYVTVFVLICVCQQIVAVPLDCGVLMQQMAVKEKVAVNHLLKAVAQLLCKNRYFEVLEQGGESFPNNTSEVVGASLEKPKEQENRDSQIQRKPTKKPVAPSNVSTARPNKQNYFPCEGDYCSEDSNVFEDAPGHEKNIFETPDFYDDEEEANSGSQTRKNVPLDRHNNKPAISAARINQPVNLKFGNTSSVVANSCLCPGSMVPVPVVVIQCKEPEELRKE